jgi:hypothetical protein
MCNGGNIARVTAMIDRVITIMERAPNRVRESSLYVVLVDKELGF